MKYLVIHQLSKDLTGVSIEEPGKVYPHVVKCWAIKNGDQVQFVHMRMHKLLKVYYFSGTYENCAKHFMEFDQLWALMTKYMGPDDEAIYDLLLEESGSFGERRGLQIFADNAPSFLWGVLDFSAKFMWLGVKFIAFQSILPVLIFLFRKPK